MNKNLKNSGTGFMRHGYFYAQCIALTALLSSAAVQASEPDYYAGYHNDNGTAQNRGTTPVVYDRDEGVYAGRVVVQASAAPGQLDANIRIEQNSWVIYSEGEYGQANAGMRLDDLMLIDTANPASTGQAEISVNLFIASSVTSYQTDRGFTDRPSNGITNAIGRNRTYVSLAGTTVFDQTTDGSFSGLFTTGSALVPLNSPFSLNMGLESNATLTIDIDTAASLDLNGTAMLAGMNGSVISSSFNLPDGFRISSLQGGFSETGGASTVPVPGAVWLLGSGLIALIGVARRRA